MLVRERLLMQYFVRLAFWPVSRSREEAPLFPELNRPDCLVGCFDPEWGPMLIRDWQYTLTPSGEFAKTSMRNQPK